MCIYIHIYINERENGCLDGEMNLRNKNLSQNNQGKYPREHAFICLVVSDRIFTVGSLSFGRGWCLCFSHLDIWFGTWHVRIYPGSFKGAFWLWEAEKHREKVKAEWRPALKWTELPGMGYSLLLPVWVMALTAELLVPTYETFLYWFLLGFSPLPIN